jgi:hypothetical protein
MGQIRLALVLALQSILIYRRHAKKEATETTEVLCGLHLLKRAGWLPNRFWVAAKIVSPFVPRKYVLSRNKRRLFAEVIFPATLRIALDAGKTLRQGLFNGFSTCLMLVVWTCVLCGGCVSHQKRIDQARNFYWQGNFEAAENSLHQAMKRPKKDADVLKLDQAMVSFSKGKLKQSGDLLREVRDRFDQPSFGEKAQKATSYLTDDNSRPYEGEDHEKTLLRVMLTLIDLVEQGGDAVAYAHQVGQSIEELLASRHADRNLPEESSSSEDKLPSSSPPHSSVQLNSTGSSDKLEPDIVKEELAIAPLLRALVRSSSRLNQDEVLRNLKMAIQWRPQSAFLRQELVAAAEQRELVAGYGSAYLVMLVGRGPVKRSVSEPVTSQSLLIADQILSGLGEYSLPPTIAPVKIAAIEPSISNVDGIQVSTGGRVIGSMETIADLNRLALARHQELLPQIIARAVVRRVVKKSVVVATKAHTNVQDDLVSTAYNVAGVLWEASEKADLRSWSLLPGQILIFRLDLPVGTHRIELYPTFQGKPTRSQSLTCSLEVLDGQATFAVGTILDRNQHGSVYTAVNRN